MQDKDLSMMSNKDVLNHLQSNIDTGLSTEEVTKRQELFGLNEFKEEEKESLFDKLLE